MGIAAAAVPAAILGGSLIQGIGGWLGSRSAADAQREAANTALQGTRESIAAQRGMYDQGRMDLAPWRNAGAGALGEYQRLLGMGSNDSDLIAGREQSIAGLNQQAAGRGLFNSSFAAKGLGQLYAQTEMAREQRKYDRLAQLFGAGQGAAAQGAQLGAHAGAGIGGAYQQGYGQAAGFGAGAGMTEGQGTAGVFQGAGGALSSYGMYTGLTGGQNPQQVPGAGGSGPASFGRGG